MKNVKLILTDNYYKSTEESDRSMMILSYFFMDDVGNRINPWIDWLESSDLTGKSSNWALLDKEDNEYIVIEDILMNKEYEPNPVPSEYTLKIKISELIKLLKKWGKLYQNKAKEILITKDGEHFEINEIL